MADARSMLRASREARKIKHPHASYTSDGKLLCNLCETIIKTEAAWQGHLHSTQHTLRQSRAQDAAAARSEKVASKKRKASTMDEAEKENAKKVKPTTFAPGVEDEDEIVERVDKNDAAHVTPQNGPQQPAVNEDAPADAAELEAFEKELQEMEASMKQSSTQADVTISAAPMTAEQIAAQAREEQSAQRGRRDAELEAEKEDAARLLEDEFEEMEGLEERARKLREKREALRKATASALTEEKLPASGSTANIGEVNEDDEDDDDEDFDEWNFGAQ